MDEQLKNHNEQLLLAHNTLMKSIYELFEKLKKQNNIIITYHKLLIGGALLGILVGAMFAFNLFLIFYMKGYIQRWFL